MTIAILETVALALGLSGFAGAIVIAITQARRVRSLEKQLSLRFRDLISIRDIVLRNRLIESFSDEGTRAELVANLDQVFDEADEELQSVYLPSMFEPADVALLKSLQEREVV
jgi:hypothetical protein